VIALAASLACAGVGGWLAAHHAIAPVTALCVFALVIVASFMRPTLWLVALPGLIPVLGLASWTGSMLVDETDLLALALAAGGYARWAWHRYAVRGARHIAEAANGESLRIPLVATVLVLLFASSVAVSLGRGIADAGGLRWDWYPGYFDALNSVRIGKSFALALALAPLLIRALQQDARHAAALLGAGFALGTAIAALTVVWERAAFTGLLDFSTDYRATGMFWEMHVGGAALDGWLALGMPFVVWMLVGTRGLRSALAACLLLVASYACLATFSRGVYLAIPLSLATLLVLLLSARTDASPRRFAWAAKGAVALAATAVASYLVFREGGYRSLLAVLGVLAVLLRLSTLVRRPTLGEWFVASAMAAMLSVVGAVAASLVAKGPYVVYTAALVANAAMLTLPAPRRSSGLRTPLTLGVFGWLTFAAGNVALNWGGAGAGRDALIVLAILVLLAFARTRPAVPPWPIRLREQGIVVASAAIVAGSVTVMLGGAYMSERFATTEQDFTGRIEHWRQGLGFLSTSADWWLGKGLGRFPKSYFFGAPDATIPGSYRIAVEDGNGYLVLSGPRFPPGFAEYFRLAQRIPTAPGTYSLTFDARAEAPPVHLHVEICEQQLLYEGSCTFAKSLIVVRDKSWQRQAVMLDGAGFGAAPWYAPRIAFFALAVASVGMRVDLDNFALVGPDGRDLLANGEFDRGMARWFTVSERVHLPWHIKNLALHVLFDQGAIGLALFVLMVTGALWRLCVGRARAHPMAPYFAAALVGFLVVGAFDSLLDVPRLALAFYLVLFAGLTLREPQRPVTPS
jgi:hypothetical protein